MIASAMYLTDVDFGPTIQAVHNNASQEVGNIRLKILFPSWAHYPKQTTSKNMSSTTLKKSEELFVKGNKNKSVKGNYLLR